MTARLNILCVEDEADLLDDIVEELTEAGYQVVSARSGKQALAKLDDKRPDLILCDISMPGLDGFDVLEAVRARGADYADMPFVFLTALSDPREVVHGKRLGADDYLVKPIDYDLLLATVEARLRQVGRIHAARRHGQRSISAKLLSQRYRLTPTEARVAIKLSTGVQLNEAAEQLCITRNTLAFHIRNIYAKTDTNRQAELMALLLRTATAGDD